MSVAELINILDRRCLVFRQLRSLQRDDREEGAIPKDLYVRDAILGGNPDAREKGLKANVDLSYCSYIQCWHIAVSEHSAFWRIYGHRGVALCSSIDTLKAQSFWKNFSLHGDEIVYADTWAEAEAQGLAVPEGITPNRSAMRRKRRAFLWEEEWRIFYSPPTAKYGVLNAQARRDEFEIARLQLQLKWPEYEEIDIDSVKWISKVIVAPASPTWVVESISAVAKRHDLRCELSKI